MAIGAEDHAVGEGVGVVAGVNDGLRFAEGGGFAASYDADSEGEEGKFCVWTREEVTEVLGPDDAELFNTVYDIRPGGTISGPTLFTLADLAAYVLILAHIGPVALAVTTSLNINFLRKPEPGGLIATAGFLKLGKRLAIVDIKIESSGGKDIVAQAVATYSIPPNKNST